jgi:hypothetical protein
VLAHGYAATSLLTFYGGDAPPVVEAEEPERWTFRPPVALEGQGLAFGPAAFAEQLTRRFRRVEMLETTERRAGATPLESYVLFWVAEPRESP